MQTDKRRITSEHTAFIELVVTGSPYAVAYRQAAGKLDASDKTAHEMGSKWASRFAFEIADGKRKHLASVEAARDADVVKEAIAGILTQAEVDKKLCEIIVGQTESEKVFFTAAGPKKVMVKPDTSDVLRAIDIYHKRFGSYAKQEVDLTSGGEKLPTQTVIRWGDKDIPV